MKNKMGTLSCVFPFGWLILMNVLSENGGEAFVGGTCVGVDVVACGLSCLAESFGIVDKVVHEGGEGGEVLVFK